MIKVENLTKKFTRNDRDFDAVRNVSLEVKKGEFAAIIGHSGSGKTTLFNIDRRPDCPSLWKDLY